MEIDFAFLCDYAENTGKVNALGIGFDTIGAPQIPIRHPLMHLVAQFRASITEAGSKNVAVQIIDADGNNVSDAKGVINIKSPEAGVESTARLVVAFRDVEFNDYGDYSLHILIDDHEMKRIVFRVVEPPATS